MSHSKKINTERVVVDPKKLERLRKSLTKTIDDFKQTILESLQAPEEGPLKESLRREDLKAGPTEQVIPQEQVMKVEAQGQVEIMPEGSLEDWVNKGMPIPGRLDHKPKAVNTPEAPYANVDDEPVVLSVKVVSGPVASSEPKEEIHAPYAHLEPTEFPKNVLRSQGTKVFFAGVDNEVNSTVRLYLQKMGMRTFLPGIEGYEGKAIAEQYQVYNDFDFAVVILSADEYIFARKQDPSQALLITSPKVIFELGYLVGKLGRNRVAVFYENIEKFKRPTAYFDINYIAFDQLQWQDRLITLMKNASIPFKEENYAFAT